MNPNRMKFRRTANVVVDEVPAAPAVNFSAMPWGELTKLGLERGVYKVGMKRTEVEAALAH